MSQTVMQDGGAALATFLATLAPQDAVPVRVLARSWELAGGSLHVGKVAVRLVATDRQGRPFTAGTLHAGPAAPGPVLELCRVILAQHGLAEAAWAQWCDERPELRGHGFDQRAKYPAVRLRGLGETATARLALGLRDLRLGVQ